MKDQDNKRKVLQVTLWLAQGLLSVSLLWAAWMKLFQPAEKLAAMWPWTGQVPLALVKFTGMADLLGAVGLTLPTLLKIKPKLASITAMLVVILMIAATIFHISRGEASVIAVNLVFAPIAAFIAWGRNRYP